MTQDQQVHKTLRTHLLSTHSHLLILQLLHQHLVIHNEIDVNLTDSMRTFGLCVTMETNNLTFRSIAYIMVLYLQLSPSCLLYLYNLVVTDLTTCILYVFLEVSLIML